MNEEINFTQVHWRLDSDINSLQEEIQPPIYHTLEPL